MAKENPENRGKYATYLTLGPKGDEITTVL
jgi:hypothetical protein